MSEKEKHLIKIRQHAKKMLSIYNKDYAIYGLHYNGENHIVESFDKISYWNKREYEEVVKNTEMRYGQQGIAAVVIAIER